MTTAPRRALTANEQLHLSRQIASLVRARLPIAGELSKLVSGTGGRLAESADKVDDELLAGKPLTQALAGDASRDSQILAACIEAGERAGALDRTLEMWAEMHLAAARNKQAMRVAMVYPMLLIIVTVASLGFSIYHLIPEYAATYQLFYHSLPVWLEVIAWLHRQWWWVVFLLAVIPLAATMYWFWRRGTLDRSRMPRMRSGLLRLQALASGVSAELLMAGAPLADIVRLVTRVMWARDEDVEQAFPRLMDQQLVVPLPRETSLVLASLHTGLISQQEAADHLRQVAQHLKEAADMAARRDVQWYPMFISLLVGGLTIAAYVGLVYVPWALMLRRIVE